MVKRKAEEEWTYREWVVPANLDSNFMGRKPLTKEDKAVHKQIIKMMREAREKWKKKQQENRSFWP